MSNDLSNDLLSRELGVRQLAAIIFNYTVGSGIFVLPAIVAAQLGPAAILAYLVCALVMGLAVLCFAEAGSRVSSSGGPYAYVDAAFGPLAGFVIGVLNLASALLAAAAVASIFAASAAALVGIDSRLLQQGLIVVVLAAVAAINVSGVSRGARLVELAATAKLLPLVVFIVAGAAFVRPEYLQWSTTPSLPSVGAASGLLIFAFLGIEGALQPSGEVRNPERTVPWALTLAIGGVVVLYVSIQLVAQGVLGPALPSDRVAPLATAAGSVAGPMARTFMLAGATVSMFGFLCGTALTGPRSLFAFARAGLAPGPFGRVHPTRRTPYVAIVAYAAVAAALALTGSFERLLVLTNVSGLLVYVGVALAAWELRRRDVRTHGDPFVAPGGALAPTLSCLTIGGIIVAVATWVEIAAVAGAIALTVGGWWMVGGRGASPGSGSR